MSRLTSEEFDSEDRQVRHGRCRRCGAILDVPANTRRCHVRPELVALIAEHQDVTKWLRGAPSDTVEVDG